VPAPHSYTTWDGIEIAYREWGEQGSSPPIVLHHGFVAHAEANWLAPGVIDSLLAEAIADAKLEIVRGNHLQAITDPRFTQAIVEFLG
jgi:alpha-beta hydrolase superfamily lysophospholipase